MWSDLRRSIVSFVIFFFVGIRIVGGVVDAVSGQEVEFNPH